MRSDSLRYPVCLSYLSIFPDSGIKQKTGYAAGAPLFGALPLLIH